VGVLEVLGVLEQEREQQQALLAQRLLELVRVRVRVQLLAEQWRRRNQQRQ
jgi:hypothetical protein